MRLKQEDRGESNHPWEHSGHKGARLGCVGEERKRERQSGAKSTVGDLGVPSAEQEGSWAAGVCHTEWVLSSSLDAASSRGAHICLGPSRPLLPDQELPTGWLVGLTSLLKSVARPKDLNPSLPCHGLPDAELPRGGQEQLSLVCRAPEQSLASWGKGKPSHMRVKLGRQGYGPMVPAQGASRKGMFQVKATNPGLRVPSTLVQP